MTNSGRLFVLVQKYQLSLDLAGIAITECVPQKMGPALTGAPIKNKVKRYGTAPNRKSAGGSNKMGVLGAKALFAGNAAGRSPFAAVPYWADGVVKRPKHTPVWVVRPL